MTPANVSGLWNSENKNHQKNINELLKTTTQFDCVAAFAKMSGLELIDDTLLERLKDGMAARFIIGLDFCHSEPELLQKLLDLKKKYAVEVLVSELNKESSWTFHPKIYRFDHGDYVSLMIGSANLTRGGLSKNHEVSAFLSMTNDAQVSRYLRKLIANEDVVELTPEILTSYRKRYVAYRIMTNVSERQTKRVLETANSGIEVLRAVLREMKEGGKKSVFMTQIENRKWGRAEAEKALTQVRGARRLSRKKFLRLYGLLAKMFWHSGGLNRNKTRIAKKPDVFQQIVTGAATSFNGPVAKTYEQMRILARGTSGIGPNVLTEILHTYDNSRYAVMNQNSVDGMKLAGFQNFPEKPNKHDVDGRLYEKFCKRAKSVQCKLGLETLSELDAVFNEAYWQDSEIE
jgi:HKD family nuclease